MASMQVLAIGDKDWLDEEDAAGFLSVPSFESRHHVDKGAHGV